jgi:hypothetical protein
VTLSWAAPHGAPVTSYNVTRNDGTVFSGILTTTFTDSSVVTNTSYYYTVAGLNGAIVGTSSPPSLNVKPLSRIPMAADLVASISTDGSFNLSWTAVKLAGNYEIGFNKDTDKVSQLRKTSTGGKPYITSIDSSNTAIVTADSLVSGTKYTFTLYSNYSNASFGDESDSIPATANITYYNVPAQVSTLNVMNGGDKRVDLSWNSPATAANPVTSFEIYGSKTLSTFTAADLISSNKLGSFTASQGQHTYFASYSLPSNGSWKVAIVSSNNGVLSTINNANSITIAPLIKFPNPTSTTVAWDLSNEKFIFNIVPPSSSALLAADLTINEPFKYYVSSITDLSNTPAEPTPVVFTRTELSYNEVNNTYTIGKTNTGLNPSEHKKYYFTIDASYSNHANGKSSGVNTQGITLYASTYFKTSNKYSADIKARVGTDKTVTLDWSPYTTFTAEKAHISVTGYKLDISGSSIPAENQTYTLGSSQTEKTLTLSNGMNYRATVTPIVSNSDPNAITPIPVNPNMTVDANTVDFSPYVQATTVRNLIAGTSSSSTVDLSWNAPSGSYGTNKTLQGYNVYLNGVYNSNVTATTSSVQVKNMTGLIAGELNKFGIIPVVTHSNSTLSNQEVGTMTEVSHAALVPLTMAAVSNSSSNGFITLTWSALAANNFKGYSNISYDVYQVNGSADIFISNTSTTSVSTNLDYLTNTALISGTSYNYKVIAKANSVNDITNTTFVKSTAQASGAVTCNNNKVLGVPGLTAKEVVLRNAAGTADANAISISWTAPNPQFMGQGITFQKYLVKVNGTDVSPHLVSKDLSVTTGGATLLSTGLALSNNSFNGSHSNGTNEIFVKISNLALNFGTTYNVTVTIEDTNNVAGAVASTTVTPSLAPTLPAFEGLTLKSQVANGTSWDTTWTLKVDTNGSELTSGFMMITPDVYNTNDTLVLLLTNASNATTNTVRYSGDFTFTTKGKTTRPPFFVVTNGKGLVTNITSSPVVNGNPYVAPTPNYSA